MKMAKKLLAVVLAGVMAVSMLTGCALSDKVKAEALEKALNSTQVKAATQNPDEAKNVTFSYKSDLNSVAGKAWGDENGMRSGKATSFATTYVGKLAEYTNGGKKYFTYVVDVTDVKTGKSGEWTTRAVDLRDAVANKGFGTTKETIKDYNADNTKKTGKFGFDIKSVTNDVSGSKKTTNYAIIVFEAGANA